MFKVQGGEDELLWKTEEYLDVGFQGNREGEYLNLTGPYPIKHYLPFTQILAEGQS